jgi:hypothetical protein
MLAETCALGISLPFLFGITMPRGSDKALTWDDGKGKTRAGRHLCGLAWNLFVSRNQLSTDM